jgi:hypothetical protein
MYPGDNRTLVLPGVHHGLAIHIPEFGEQEDLLRVAMQFTEAVDRFGIFYGSGKYCA